MADILIVDDDVDYPEVLGSLLEDEGHVVRIASNGEKGLRELEQRLPDLLVLDVEMPVLTGPELSYHMLVRDSGMEDVPILLTSGIPDLKGLAERIGTPYYLSKPYTFEQIESLIARALTSRIPPAHPEGLLGHVGRPA